MPEIAFDAKILNEWPRITPVLEAVGVMVWTTAANDNKCLNKSE
jgi:hypothetical protein